MEGWIAVRLSEKKCLERLLAIKEFDEVQRKRELHINEEYIAESTLDIWCKKRVPYPKLIQYEVYKCFILKFELAFSGFINPVVDLFHYTLKDIVFCDNVDEVRESNIENLFEKGIKINKDGTTKFINILLLFIYFTFFNIY